MRKGRLVGLTCIQVAANMGKEGDATPFTDVTVDNISIALHKCGYQSRGWEVGAALDSCPWLQQWYSSMTCVKETKVWPAPDSAQ